MNIAITWKTKGIAVKEHAIFMPSSDFSVTHWKVCHYIQLYKQHLHEVDWKYFTINCKVVRNDI